MEDDDATSYLIESAFRDAHPEFKLFRARDAGEALDFLHKSAHSAIHLRPDLILSNLSLPGMDGADLLRAIQNDPALQDIPVVMFSSSKLDSDRARCLALGAKHFINKPGSYTEFVGAVRSACCYIKDGALGAAS